MKPCDHRFVRPGDGFPQETTNGVCVNCGEPIDTITFAAAGVCLAEATAEFLACDLARLHKVSGSIH